MDISVIIPTFNREVLVKRAINSVLSQTCPPEEIIVVDDGSTDQTSRIIAEEFPQITLLTQANKGVSAARNKGIRHANCDWLAFLDSDDEWAPSKLEKQINALRNRRDFVACHTDEIWMRNGNRVNAMKKHQKPEGWIFQQCLPLCCVSPSSVVLKKALFSMVGDFDEALPACEDYDMWLRIFSIFPVLLLQDKLVIKYGGHDDQLSKKHWGMDRFRVTALIKILEQGVLREDQKMAATATLLKKLEILMQGFQKRNNDKALAEYADLYDLWRTQ